MKHDNRLILDDEQIPHHYVPGEKISSAGTAGNFGFARRPTEVEVVELRHVLDVGTEPVYITRELFKRIAKAFKR